MLFKQEFVILFTYKITDYLIIYKLLFEVPIGSYYLIKESKMERFYC